MPAQRPGAEGVAFPAPVGAGATAPLSHDEDDEDDDARPRHPYTWLHFLALALVAFVLGFLIVLLWSRSGGLAADSASAPAAHAVSSVVVDSV